MLLREVSCDRGEATAQPWNERLLAAVSPRRHRLHADDREGGAWISTDGEGLWHVSAAGQLEEATADPAFPGSQVECMETDVEGNLWLGLTRLGLARLRPRLFMEPPVTPANDGSVLARTSHSMCVDSAGTIWLTEPGGGLWKTTAETIEQVAEPARPALVYTSVVAPARGGGVWLAPQFASVVRQEGDQRRDVFDTIAVRSVARVMHEDREGSLWIGNEYGLWRWRDGAVAAVAAADGFSPIATGDAAEPIVPGVEALADAGAGGLWIGLSQCELRHRNADGRFTAYRPPWWDPGIRFWSLLPDGDGGVWIGTLGSGLVHFRDGVFRRVTTAHGLPDDAVSQILDDGRGHLWLGTFSGVVRIARSEIDEVFSGRSARVRCRRFGRAAGLPVAQCSSGQQPRCLKAPDGRLWFSTTGGVVIVDPAEVRDAPPPPVVIEEVRVQGGDVLSQRPLPLELSPGAQPPGTHGAVHVCGAGAGGPGIDPLPLADGGDRPGLDRRWLRTHGDIQPAAAGAVCLRSRCRRWRRPLDGRRGPRADRRRAHGLGDGLVSRALGPGGPAGHGRRGPGRRATPCAAPDRYSNREIADRFGISVATVRSHLRNIYAKLHVRSRTQAALKYRGR